MADCIDIARPYAKAIFMHALDEHTLSEWSQWLDALQLVVQDPNMVAFVGNPETTTSQHAKAIVDILLKVCAANTSTRPAVLESFIKILAANRRLSVVSAIYQQFEALRADQEQRVTVSVTSFSPLNEAQQQRLGARLSERLGRKVELQLSIDPSLLGGAVISAKDWVINASLRGQLDKLSAALGASARG